MPTREEIERRLEEIRQQRAEIAARRGERYVPDEEWSGSKTRGRIGALGQGALLGWSDELSAGLAAGMAKLGGDDRSYRDIYRDIHGAEEERQEGYRRANPTESMLLEVGGGLGTGALGLARATGRRVTQEGLKRVLANPQAVQAPGRLSRTLRGAGVVAGESAVAGAGAANGDLSNRLQGAGVGAAAGLGTAGLFKAGGATLRGLSKRRVEQELGRGEDFIPLNVADEGTIGDVYREGLGRVWGARGQLKRQTERHMAKAAREEARAAERLSGVKDTLKTETATAQESAKLAKEKVLNEGQARLDQQAMEAREAMQMAKDQAETRIGQRAERVANEAAERLRRQAASEALPSDAPQELRDAVAKASPLQAKELIKDWWQNHGFADIKGRDFEWTGDLAQRLDNIVGKDPALALELGDVWARIPGMTERMQRAALKIAKAEGKELATLDQAQVLREALQDMTHINGDALLAMRNAFARPSNRTSDLYRSGALRRVANAFDDEMRAQMRAQGDEAGAALFDEHLGRWAVRNNYVDAVDKAFTKSEGRFSPEQWLAASRMKNEGAPLHGSARSAQRRIEAVRAGETGAKQKLARQMSEGRVAQSRAEKQAQTQLRDRAAREGRKVLRRAELKIDAPGRLRRAKSGLEKAAAKVKAIKRRNVPENVSGLSSALATTALAAAPGLVTAGLGGSLPVTALALATGAMSGKALTSEAGQRFVAGQTDWQKVLAQLLRETEDSRRAAMRGAYRSTAVQAGEE